MASSRFRCSPMDATSAPTFVWNARSRLRTPACAAEKTDDYEQHDGAYKSDKDRPRNAGKRRPPAHLSKEPAADDGAEDADHNVSQDPVADTAHHQRRQKPGDQSHDDPGQDVHREPRFGIGCW